MFEGNSLEIIPCGEKPSVYLLQQSSNRQYFCIPYLCVCVCVGADLLTWTHTDGSLHMPWIFSLVSDKLAKSVLYLLSLHLYDKSKIAESKPILAPYLTTESLSEFRLNSNNHLLNLNTEHVYLNCDDCVLKYRKLSLCYFRYLGSSTSS